MSSLRVVAADDAFDGVRVAGVVGGPAGFVAWGWQFADEQTVLAHSADGESWQRLSLGPSFASVTVADVAAYRGGYVAVGATLPPPPEGNVLSVGGPDHTAARAWWSPDGTSWFEATVDNGPGLWMLRVGAAGLRALGGTGCTSCIGPAMAWRSDDGRTWHQAGSDELISPAYGSDGARIVRFDWQDERSMGGGSADAGSAVGRWVEVSTDGLRWQMIADLPKGDFEGKVVVVPTGILLPLGTPGRGSGAPLDEVDAGIWYLSAE